MRGDIALLLLASLTAPGCGSGSSGPAATGSSDGGAADGASGADGGGGDTSADGGLDAGADGQPSTVSDSGGYTYGDAMAAADATYVYDDGGLVLRADRFVTSVVSFSPAGCAGYGQDRMPEVVYGPPVGGGTEQGSTDVVSLGSGGSIVVGFAPNAIIDGPGADFIVFENAFWIGGSPNTPYGEPGEVSISDDGVTWTTYPCVPSASTPYPVLCAGWQVVYSNPQNGISPVDPAVAGGLALDLGAVGVSHARYVRIVDKTHEACPDSGTGPTSNGFDLDAVSIVNAELP